MSAHELAENTVTIKNEVTNITVIHCVWYYRRINPMGQEKWVDKGDRSRHW